jgi:hypothetical protein
MDKLFIVGIGTGMLFYIVKLIAFYIGTHSKYTRWIRNMFHKTAFGLFTLDLIAGFVITGTIHSVGADGLTVLFIFIGFTLTSILYIVGHITFNWTRRILCTNGLLSSVRHYY